MPRQQASRKPAQRLSPAQEMATVKAWNETWEPGIPVTYESSAGAITPATTGSEAHMDGPKTLGLIWIDVTSIEGKTSRFSVPLQRVKPGSLAVPKQQPKGAA